MAEVVENIEPVAENKEPSQSALDEVFTERDNGLKQDVKSNTKTPEQIDLPKQGAKQEIKKKAIEHDDDDEDVPNTSSAELDKLKQELEKTKKALTENQKWGRTNSQKLKAALKKVQSFTAEGTLTEEEAKDVLSLLESEVEGELEPESYENLNPVQKILKVANQELENIRKYTDDALLDKKVCAFDFLLNNASEEEMNEILEELTELQDNPVKLAKRMLLLGEHYYDEVYKDFEESGGLKRFTEKKKSEVEKLQKKIDKLEKKLSQYEEYDKSTFRIDELSDSDKLESVKPKSAFDEAVQERDRVRR